jgi:16S rRNA (guanine527-N7)-methyltransferase
MMITEQQQAQLEGFVQAVEASPHNLVSRSARAELRARHLREAVHFAQSLPSGPGRVLDIGSGGGFPGLPIAIVRPDLRVELLDATGKKARFLRDVAEALGLEVVVHHGRAEDLARGSLAGAFDLVTARAVAGLDRLIPWALPFLAPGGELWAIKGERWAEEVDQAAAVCARLGARVVGVPHESTAGRGLAPRVVRIGRTGSKD